ncbi:MAG: GxxExxY protein [Nitrospirae bacterium CG08_land_8_20_14_0_20_52_24]|nr:MAG: GxxExxY protein [Nitrospirae bacterium CG2_30_53_67]PIS37813.1 MAG: GxxExxY protein [Nitrospirae bacterium CG08_land_8_20_14_0_20_52_24]PIW85523.1 MAG: GxxExxY protein [Nitrospirae bacterium CG_4_8_14_3_um_filter_50_41]
MKEITEKIIGAAIEVHKTIGPGLLESAYEECLAHEMQLRGLKFDRQVPLPVTYKGVKLECGYRLDFLVEEAVVLELKVVDALQPIHEAQLLTYLKLGGWTVGLKNSPRSLRLRGERSFYGTLVQGGNTTKRSSRGPFI